MGATFFLGAGFITTVLLDGALVSRAFTAAAFLGLPLRLAGAVRTAVFAVALFLLPAGLPLFPVLFFLGAAFLAEGTFPEYVVPIFPSLNHSESPINFSLLP